MSVTEASRQKYAGGSEYGVDAGVFHTTWVEDGQFAATIALTVPVGDSPPQTVGPFGAATHREFSREPAPGDKVRVLIEELVDRLSARP